MRIGGNTPFACHARRLFQTPSAYRERTMRRLPRRQPPEEDCDRRDRRDLDVSTGELLARDGNR